MSDFDRAVRAVRCLPTTHVISDVDRLLVYALYKQATCGNIQTGRPSVFAGFEARAKWDAWKRREGTTRTDAALQYIQQVDRLCPGWRDKILP